MDQDLMLQVGERMSLRITILGLLVLVLCSCNKRDAESRRPRPANGTPSDATRVYKYNRPTDEADDLVRNYGLVRIGMDVTEVVKNHGISAGRQHDLCKGQPEPTTGPL